MDRKVLRFINLLAVPVILFTVAFFILLIPEDIGIGVKIGFLIFWLVLYLNIRISIRDFIDVQTKAKVLAVDQKRLHRLKFFKSTMIIAGLLIWVLFWLVLWPDTLYDIINSILFILFILVAVLFLNIFLGVNYLFTGKICPDRLSIVVGLVLVFLILAFVWFYMTSQIVYAIPLICLVALLLFIYYNVKRAAGILKVVNNKPADLRRERQMKIILYACIFAILAIILLSRYLSALLWMYVLIGLVIMVVIVANVWKFIQDIS